MSSHPYSFYDSRLEFEFLDIFLTLQSFTDEPNLLDDVTQKVHALFQDVALDCDRYCPEGLENKIWSAKMEIKANYSFPKISSLPLSENIPKIVAQSIHTVVKNLHYIENMKINDLEPEEHIIDVLQELKYLEIFVCFVSQRFNIERESQHDHVVNFFTHVFVVAGHAAMMFWLCLPDLAQEEIHGLLSEFLQMRIKPIQPCIRKIYVDVLQSLKSTILHSGWCPHIENEHAEANFLEAILHNLVKLTSNINFSQSVALKDQLENFQTMLNLLRANIHPLPMQDLEFLRDIDTAVIDAGLLVYSFYEGEEEEKEDMAPREVVDPRQVFYLSSNIQRMNSAIYLTIRKAIQSNLPRIHGLGYVDFLLNNLKELQAHHADLLSGVEDQLQIIQKQFESLQNFLEAVAHKSHNKLNVVQHCATKLIERAYEVEYSVGAYLKKEAPIWCLERWLSDIMEEINLIKEEVAEIHEKKMVADATNSVTAHTSSDLARFPRMNEEIVGFEDVIEKLRDQLIKGHKGRDVIAVVGMPGLGKTTLAYRLYSDSSVVTHFDIRAQCCVSQIYSRKNVLLAILREVVGEDPKLREKQADHLADELRKALLPQRYLILIDDVWEASAWDDLQGCFQDANIGSRIILTTRNHEVANCARFQSEPFPLRMFTDDESWELLRKKVFGEESCPSLLINIGQQIAKKCGQLPLSVALVAGILAKMEKKQECWEQLSSELGPHIHKDSRDIIEQSYQILPYHLRSCFLYFGAFLEDDVINVSKLIRLWISEGFIKRCADKTLEDIAEDYLENLVGRNLVMPSKKSFRGKIKACHIHDVIHDFCKERAKEENFLQCIKWDKNIYPPSHSSHSYCHKQLPHRISFHGEGYPVGEWTPCRSRVSCIILNHGGLSFDTISHIFQRFKFLKVLDLEFILIDRLPTDLVYLRYFAALFWGLSELSRITNYWNLETLLIHNLGIMTAPITLWDMVKLRHLHISRISIEDAKELIWRKTPNLSSKKLYDLKTLSTLYFSHVEDLELILSKTPNLRELECVVNYSGPFQRRVLKFPAPTETLKIRTSFDCALPFRIYAPNLKKLNLSGFHPDRHISTIASFQNLQVLKLKDINFRGGWKVSNGEYPQLKVLKLQLVLFRGKWSVADDAFPNLERLVLYSVYDLKEIPSCFGEISSLKSIEVTYCRESVGKSARDIRETQVENYQNNGFEVLIIDKSQKHMIS